MHMSVNLNLKEMERRAFRSTYQDGLWDIYMGGMVAGFAMLTNLPDSDEFPLGRFLLYFGVIAMSYLIFWAGKKFITLPRLGKVKFGAERRKRKRTLGIILGVIVAIQTVVVLLSIVLWAEPELGAGIGFLSGDRRATDLLVASLGALFVGPSLALVAYFNDFPRGYYIAVVMAAAVFLMIWFDRPVYLLIAAAMIILPGIVLFLRFLRQYPRPPAEALNA
jgi:hypothetical protein